MPEQIVILGAGQAGAQVAVSLRQSGFVGDLTLIGEERQLPYQRPPLSKAYLAGEMPPERTLIRSADYYARRRIDVIPGLRIERLLPDQKTLVAADGGRIAYDMLVLATGTRARQLDVPGVDLGNVMLLRTIADSDRLRAIAGPGRRAVIVGGGYIGLEVAASLTKLGATVTVLEALERVMNRVVAPPISAFFAAEHAAHGVDVRTGVGVVALEGAGQVERLRCSDGTTLPTDLAVIGVGAVPNDELARAAGLAVDNGILVDACGRTSDPAIYAAGDVTNHPNALFDRRLRLESVQNAIDQGKAVASALIGKPTPYAEVPWFWSDQYDLKLQIAGLGDPDDALIMRGDPASRAFSCLHLRDHRLVAVDCVNRGGDFLAAKRLIAERSGLDPARAADPEVKLADARVPSPA